MLSDTGIKDDKVMGEPAVKVSNIAEMIATGSNTPIEAPEAAQMSHVKGLVENVHQVEVKLADLQADPNSPLYSATSFEELHLPDNILKGVYAMKFNRPSKVQEKALPLILSNPPQNLIAQSQSGTGKTAAFVLTMLCRINENDQWPQALCLTPTRELARQIIDVVKQMAQFTNIKLAAAIKEDSDIRSGIQSTPFTEQIIVGTPGTVREFERRRLIDFKKLKVLVFDEADVMFGTDNMGNDSYRLKKSCPDSVQVLLFSATFKDAVMEAATRLVPRANVLTLKREELSVDAIRQFYMNVPGGVAQKLQMLSNIYGLLTLGQSIIFAYSRDMSERVQAHMELEGFKTCVLHGGMSPAERDAVIDAFRKGACRVLISTNVIARGIDVLQVSLVINFDMPFDGDRRPDPETYLHRIGRTGRFGRSGVSINFISDDKSKMCQDYIKNHFNRPINEISTQDLETLDKQLGNDAN